MANICNNKFYFWCDDSETCKQFISDLSDAVEYVDYDSEDNWAEGYFDSRWDFPTDLFLSISKNWEGKGVYFRCLSEEYGCELVSMNVYKNDYWTEPQYFDL